MAKKRSEMTVDEFKSYQKDELKKKQAKADAKLSAVVRAWGKSKDMKDEALIAYFEAETPEEFKPKKKQKKADKETTEE